MTREQCQFVTEQECLPLEKEKCKKFPETLCDIVNVTKSQQQCHEVEEVQVWSLNVECKAIINEFLFSATM